MNRLALAMIAVASLFLSGCAGMQLGPNTTTGIGIGAIGGAILNRDNPAAGAIIGGAIGGAVGSAADNNNGNYSGPVYNGGYPQRGCDYRCQDYRREQARRAEWERQQQWARYCRSYEGRYDRRCRY